MKLAGGAKTSRDLGSEEEWEKVEFFGDGGTCGGHRGYLGPDVPGRLQGLDDPCSLWTLAKTADSLSDRNDVTPPDFHRD